MRNFMLSGIAGVALLASVTSAKAAVMVFSGVAAGADSAAASFGAAASAIGSLNLLTFENLQPVSPVPFTYLGSGVTVTGTSASNLGIRSAPIGDAYNTTPGGQNYLIVFGRVAIFTFASPVNSFGAYLTGVSSAGETLIISDGSPQSVTLSIPENGSQFLGFIDNGASISSVTIRTYVYPDVLGGDVIGVDDVRFTTAAAAVPEPASLALLGAGLAGLAIARKRRGQPRVKPAGDDERTLL